MVHGAWCRAGTADRHSGLVFVSLGPLQNQSVYGCIGATLLHQACAESVQGGYDIELFFTVSFTDAHGAHLPTFRI